MSPTRGRQVNVVDADNPGLIGFYTSSGFKPTPGEWGRTFTARPTVIEQWIRAQTRSPALLGYGVGSA